MKKKVRIQSGQPTGRLTCPACGNDYDFLEVAENVTVTARYLQNDDGSFTPQESETEILGEIKLFCAACDQDLSEYHSYFQEMIF